MEQRAEILRALMEEKGMKVSDIVKISGLPYSTVKAILERGAEKAGYVNVCKICNALGISADELEKKVADNNYKPSPPSPPILTVMNIQKTNWTKFASLQNSLRTKENRNVA